MQAYATEQAALRLDDQNNAIDTVLAGTPAEGMYTDDFMFYMGDMPAGPVQYGQRVDMCSWMMERADKKPSILFPELITYQIEEKGFDPIQYDTRSGAPITTLIVDPYDSARPWTYQYCTEFGWF